MYAYANRTYHGRSHKICATGRISYVCIQTFSHHVPVVVPGYPELRVLRAAECRRHRKNQQTKTTSKAQESQDLQTANMRTSRPICLTSSRGKARHIPILRQKENLSGRKKQGHESGRSGAESLPQITRGARSRWAAKGKTDCFS